MITVSRRSLRKLAVVALGVVSLIYHHQLSYEGGFALSSHLAELIDVIDVCPRPAFEKDGGASSRDDSGIPNFIHQIWKTTDVNTYPMAASHESWKAMFEPMNYTVKMWTDEDILRLIIAKYSWLLPTYEGYPQNIQRADVARLVVVHAEGGIYADLDVHPTSFEGILCLQQLGLRGIFAPTARTFGLSNHFFMAERGSAFLQWALQETKRRGVPSKRILLPYLKVFWSTGPMMVTSALRQYKWMYDSTSHELGVVEESYGRSVIQHAAGRSWHGPDGRLLNYLADHMSVEGPLIAVFSLATVLGFAWMIFRRCSRRTSNPEPTV
ncbi:hypothetical protein BBP40_004096 [Aspergillus hancockii]|nr:hypothetical protein BBP40_004096 [Aspergillus hancockii]